MPSARQFECHIKEILWRTPTVMQVRFRVNKKFAFEPGQFVSIIVPPKGDHKSVKRAYSFSGSPEMIDRDGYELCVKFVPGGRGTEYLASLKGGDTFTALAPYGDFEYEIPTAGRSVCFIATGTGIAPFKSVVLSKKYAENRPASALCLFGTTTEQEIIYPGLFEAHGVETVYCLDAEKGQTSRFKGRVGDYLKTLPSDWAWHTTDFYLCGNGRMVVDVTKLLVSGHGVSEKSIHKESFAAAVQAAQPAAAVPRPPKAA